ncbi:MAG: EF-P lysine aminoacylase GenX [Desulfamplus sp.]|nr:EF-P lysine aminoacylase GenX [Desulfamplus sp.]
MKHLEKRAEVIFAIRNFFQNQGYLEVETPIRIPTPIPEEHINPFESEGWYLQSSPEICMKRLAARGYGKIFQICKCFRKDERGDRHLTELTMVEWYKKDYSYMELMNECQEMIQHVASSLKSNQIKYGSYNITLDKSWQQIKVKDAFDKYGSISMQEAEAKGSFDEVMAFEIEPNLGLDVPTFIYDYPASMASLAKLKSDGSKSNLSNQSQSYQNKGVAERFELYIAGIELANGFSELTDPVEQEERLKQEIKKIEAREILAKREIKNSDKAIKIPEKFIKELSNMPKTAGIALGVDRLIMLFSNAKTIDEVVAFTPEEL